ncbi:DUF2567 domain-containing protein [Tsukamurella conjunctivitidis]|uniref:DUF2567 domain-containing protein n=1 Tax=Tsukamurella conjunctivitidis TaxID=2592068 RepID=A0A5C5RTS9_9ACTN|nr:DUF2567 domain-containing protein [Tsukamurella conjunctivitidis]
MTTAAPSRTVSDVVVPGVIAAVLGAAAGLLWGLTVPGVRGVLTRSGVVWREGQLDNIFQATVLFVAVTAVGGLLTGALIFVGRRRDPRGVAVTLGAAAFAVLIATLLGQAVVDARFAGPGEPGLDFTAAPSIRLDGANVFALADHSGGVLGDVASWVLLLVWPACAALWCTLSALVGRLPEESVAGVAAEQVGEVGDGTEVVRPAGPLRGGEVGRSAEAGHGTVGLDERAGELRPGP